MSLGVMRPWRGLRMVLDRENRVFPVLDTLYGLVVEVQMGHFERFRPRDRASLTPNSEAVVLRRYKYLPCR